MTDKIAGMTAANELDRVVYPEYAIPTAGIIPQPITSNQSPLLRMEAFNLQKTQQTSTKRVSIRSQASQAFKTSAGRTIMACIVITLVVTNVCQMAHQKPG